MNWQPIDTAPRDGTPVDLWVKALGCEFRATDFKWRSNQWVGLTSDETMGWHFGNVAMEITHWMPQPGKPDRITPITEQQWREISGISSAITIGELHPFRYTGTTTEPRQVVARAKNETYER